MGSVRRIYVFEPELFDPIRYGTAMRLWCSKIVLVRCSSKLGEEEEPAGIGMVGGSEILEPDVSIRFDVGSLSFEQSNLKRY